MRRTVAILVTSLGVGGVSASSASAASWTIEPTPAISNSSALWSVACASASLCIAVGETVQSHRTRLMVRLAPAIG